MSEHSKHEPHAGDLPPQHAVPVEPPDAADVQGGAIDLTTSAVSARGYNVPSATADGTRGNPPDTAV
jgi:hypothetical protein